jgi:hypothetical protein
MKTWMSILFLVICISCQNQLAQREAKLQKWHTMLQQMKQDKKQYYQIMIENLIKKVQREGNSREGWENIKRAKELQQKTGQILAQLDVVYHQKSPDIEKINQKLEDFVNHLYAEFSDLGFQKPKYRKDKHQDFPLMQISSYLKQPDLDMAQIKVLSYANKILKVLSSADLCRDFYCYGVPTFFVHLPSKYVKQHNVAKANIMVGSISPKASPKMLCNGVPIPLEEGMGTITLKTHKEGVQELLIQATFNHKGRDTTLYIKQKYWVLPSKTAKNE